MAWTQQDLETLEEAYKSGVKKVKFKDRETEYRDLDEMQKILREARGDITGRSCSRVMFARSGRGYQ